MRLIGLIFGWYLLFGAGFALPLAAAGYDCNRASTPSEIAICADSDLSATDAVINYIWKGHTHSDAVRLDQRQWLVLRDACGADGICLYDRYRAWLAAALSANYLESPFDAIEVLLAQGYDFGTRRSVQMLIVSGSGAAYNVSYMIFSIRGADVSIIPWRIPLFDEWRTTCGLLILDGPKILMGHDIEVWGYLDPPDDGYDSDAHYSGELSGFTKWVGHGDQSQNVIYRLHDGELVPARAKLDNCSDQQAKYIAVYFRDF